MTMSFESARVSLDRSSFLRISGEPGTELTCLQGCLRITHDGSPAAIELHAGQRHAVRGGPGVIVSAFESSVVQVFRPAAQPVGAVRHLHGMSGPTYFWLSAFLRRAVALDA